MPPLEHTFKFTQGPQVRLARRGARVFSAPPDLKKHKDELDGVCAALACHYVKSKLSGKRDLTHLNGLSAFDLQRENERQAMYFKGKKSNMHSLGAIAAHFNLPGEHSFAVMGLRLSRSTILQELRPGHGLLFSFAVPPYGGHACAAYHSRGKFGLGLVGTHLYLFDPNSGEHTGAAAAITDHLERKYPGATLIDRFLVHR